MKMEVGLQVRQMLSQVQLQSLNILSMSMKELQDFLQNEEIENPLMEYSAGSAEGGIPVAYREHEQFYSRGTESEDGEQELYEGEITHETIEDMVIMQLPWNQLSERRKNIVRFCVQSLDQGGYLSLSAREIAACLNEEQVCVEQVLAELKALEPRGIFASNLEECLLMQIQGMKQEELLGALLKNHLQDMADGKISSISRALRISSAEVRKLFRVIKELNPRPLNGYGEERALYILPDMILDYQDQQWSIRFNNQWTGSIGINEFYAKMMESAEEQELKTYFEQKLQRARQIVAAVEQRRKTLIGISEEIIKRQSGYLLGLESLKPMTLEEVASACGIHASTVSRAVRDKYVLTPVGCLLIRELFTTGISSETNDGAEVSRNAVKAQLKKLVDEEDKTSPYSDEQLVKLLKDMGMSISRRTVAKYRMEMGIGGRFQRT